VLHGPGLECRGVAEVEAESVAYIVCTASGMATDGYSLPYVARWAGGDPRLITATGGRVMACAREILDGLGAEAPLALEAA
jgi:hypothetical protein